MPYFPVGFPQREIGAETSRRNSKTDVISSDDLLLLAEPSLRDLPDSALPFIEPAKAPEAWFSGMDKLVKRILITSGGAECMHEAQNYFHERH